MKTSRLILPITLLTLAAAPAFAHADVERVTRAAVQDATAVDASTDGRYVVFESRAANLTEPDTTKRRRVYRRDVTTGRTTLVSRHPDGSRMAFDTEGASISGDGRRVAFAQATLGQRAARGACFVREVVDIGPGAVLAGADVGQDAAVG